MDKVLSPKGKMILDMTREFDAHGVMFPKGAHQLVAFCYSMEGENG